MSEKTTHVAESDTRHTGLRRSRYNRGQGMIEYALLITLVMLSLVGAVGVAMEGLGGFYMNLVKVITLPFP